MTNAGGVAPERSLRLGSQAARGAATLVAVRVVLWSLSLVQSVVVARTVPPRELGLYALALAVASLASRLKQIGSAEKLVRDPESELAASLGAAFAVELATALVGSFGLIAAVWLIPWSGADWRSRTVITLLGVTLLQPLAELPAALFHRRLQFNKLAARHLGASATAVAVTIGGALGGLGLWSLVLGQIAGVAASALAFWRGVTPRPSLRLERHVVDRYVRFGVPLWGVGLLYALAERGSVLVVSSVLGLATVGYVHLAQSLTARLNQANDATNAAVYPALRSIAENSARFREVLERTNRVFALGGVPLGVALALFAADWIPLAFGPTWTPAVPFVSAYCLAWGFSAIGYPCHLAFQVRGDTGPLFLYGSAAFLGRFVAVVGGVIAFGEGGLVAAVLGGAAISVATRTMMIRRMFPEFSLLALAVRPVFTAAAAVAATRLVMIAAPHAGFEPLLRGSVFTCAAVAGTWLLDRATLSDAAVQVRGAVGARAGDRYGGRER